MMMVTYRGLRIHWAWHDTRNNGPRHMAHDVKARTVLWIAECEGVARQRGTTPDGSHLVEISGRLVPLRSRDVPAVALGLLAGNHPVAAPDRDTGSLFDLTGVARPPLDDLVDVGALAELHVDDTLVTVAEVAELLAVDGRRTSERVRWWRAAQHYLAGGHRDWPPSPDILCSNRSIRLGARCVTGYPFHTAVLPPPVYFSPGQPRWHLGEIRRWAMSVGRMGLDGRQVFPLGPASWGNPLQG